MSADPRRRRVGGWTALVAAAAVAGLAVRAWILASPLGTLESDEAIVGLMALRALDGEFSAFYWGALYGGSQEALLSAVVFAVTGPSVLALKVTSLAVFAAAAVVLWRVGVRTVGEPAARFAAALFWVWPPFLVWWSTKARAYFGSGLLIGLVAVLLVLRLRERDSTRDAAALGFVLGLGVWATLQSMLLALPALAWLAFRRPGAFRSAWVAAPAFAAGASPWLGWNALNGWEAVLPRSVAGEESTYGGRFADLFTTVLPTWLGLRVPYSLDWLAGPVLGAVVTAAAVCGFLLVLVRRPPPRLEPLLVVGAAFPLLYAATSFTYYVGEPRYLVFLAPVPALLIAWALRRSLGAAAAVVAVAIAVGIPWLFEFDRQGLHRSLAQDARVPDDMGPLIEALEREGADRVLADYWIAYRLTFESGERIVATSTGFVRDQEYDRLVRSVPHPARVYVEGSRAERRARAGLRASGYRRLRADGFVAYVRR